MMTFTLHGATKKRELSPGATLALTKNARDYAKTRIDASALSSDLLIDFSNFYIEAIVEDDSLRLTEVYNQWVRGFGYCEKCDTLWMQPGDVEESPSGGGFASTDKCLSCGHTEVHF